MRVVVAATKTFTRRRNVAVFVSGLFLTLSDVRERDVKGPAASDES